MADLKELIAMGFEEERAGLALKKGGGIEGAVDWLQRNEDKTTEELKEEDGGMPVVQPGETARSLVCKTCQKKFRTQAQAEFHASKSEHTDFEESTEEIAPLTEAEKKQKLEDLRAKMAEKKAAMSEQDLKDKKRNEEINRKKTKDAQDLKEELAKKEQIKEAAKKRQEQKDDIEHKKRIRAQIEADKEARRLKAEKEKAERAGKPLPGITNAPEAVSAAPAAAPKPAASYTEARLRLQTPSGTIQKTFPAETTLFEVAHAVQEANGTQVSSFMSNFPKKIFDEGDFGQTLKEAGFVPSAALILK